MTSQILLTHRHPPPDTCLTVLTDDRTAGFFATPNHNKQASSLDGGLYYLLFYLWRTATLLHHRPDSNAGRPVPSLLELTPRSTYHSKGREKMKKKVQLHQHYTRAATGVYLLSSKNPIKKTITFSPGVYAEQPSGVLVCCAVIVCEVKGGEDLKIGPAPLEKRHL